MAVKSDYQKKKKKKETSKCSNRRPRVWSLSANHIFYLSLIFTAILKVLLFSFLIIINVDVVFPGKYRNTAKIAGLLNLWNFDRRVCLRCTMGGQNQYKLTRRWDTKLCKLKLEQQSLGIAKELVASTEWKNISSLLLAPYTYWRWRWPSKRLGNQRTCWL